MLPARSVAATFCLLVLVAEANGQDCPASPSRYLIGAIQDNQVTVSIEHTVASPFLSIAGFTSREGRTADSFLQNVRLTGAAGVVPLENTGPGAWTINGADVGDTVRIDYELDLDHGAFTWDFGREEVAFRMDENAFLVSRVGLLADYGAPDCPIDVIFEAADVAAPWTVLGPRHYRARGLSDFHNNALAFGPALQRSVATTDQGEVTFIADTASQPLAEMAARETAGILDHLSGVFGGFPASNYHIFLAGNDRPEGGAFQSSFAMLHPVPAQPVDALIWRHGFVHEIVHLWLGHSVRPAPGADLEWFKEGFTDYLAIKTLWRLGYLSTDEFSEKLENLMRRHTMGLFLSQGAVRLTEAGENKSDNRMLIYGSGAMLAFALDVEMAETRGPGQFEAMLADLFAESEEAYTVERLMQRMDDASDGAASRLLTRFDPGLMPTAFPELFEPYGMEMAFMIPDMFQIQLVAPDCDRDACRPAFLREID